MTQLQQLRNNNVFLLLSSFLIVLSVGNKVVKADAPGCTLNCPSDAPCTAGPGNYDDHNAIDGLIGNNNDNQQFHCDCPTGWTGVLCDRKFESCTDDANCYHGGSCLPGLTDSYGNDQLFCDCTFAIAQDGTRYVGKYCETPFDQICGDGSNDDLFCVNGGECNPNYESDGIPCNCPDGWEGFHCEFKTGQVPECSLQCENDGVCVVGVRSPAEAEHFHHAWSHLDIEDHQRCLCPPGFGGPTCQADAEQCGTDACYHGSSCVTTTRSSQGEKTTEYHCDCTTATDEDGNLFAGRFCQYPSTDICDEEKSLFCTNGGTCSEGDDLFQCDCPSNFDGLKCDIATAIVDGDFSDDYDVGPILCGDVYCMNGSPCIEEVITSPDGTETGRREICDCKNIVDDDDGLPFSGASCQYKATALCTDFADDDRAVRFCVNGDCPLSPEHGCDCQSGWTGDYCQVHTLAEKDPDDANPACGADGNVCLNGGVCVQTDVVQSDGSTVPESHCDCSQAFDDKHLFAGTSCEHPSTHICTARESGTSLEGLEFCTNHGTCNPNVLRGCDCLPGFTGFSCEFDVSDENPISDSNEENDVGDSDKCGRDLICHNGGSCVATFIKGTNRDEGTHTVYHCDCGTAVTENTAFAGSECQYEATEFCSEPAEGAGLEGLMFCTNHGTCNADGCDCPPHWTGDSCQDPRDPQEIIGDGEVEAEECGDVGVCLHGGRCITTTVVDEDGNRSKFQHCDCTEAFTETDLFAGPRCEFRSTDICTQNPDGDDLRGSLFCVHNGQCKENVMEGCDCPKAWTGLRCEFPAEYEDVFGSDDTTYVEEYVPCGTDFCYYGGRCINEDINGQQLEKCDCSTAMTDTDRYDGEFCQYRSTVFCSEPNGNELPTEFCTNGAECLPDGGCHCPSGYVGDRCEYPLYQNQDSEDNIAPDTDDRFFDSDDVHEDCHLKCQNGVCAKGAKDLGDLDETVEHVDHLNKTHDSQYFEHCICEDGWTGIECAYKVETCGNGEHVCFHGSTCVDNDDECDCSEADQTVAEGQEGHPLFAGDSCEHPATDICMNSDDYVGRPSYFCTNFGNCLAYVTADDDFPGCECPAEWTGPHCEIHVDSLGRDAATVVGTGARIFLIVFMAVVGVAFVLVGSSYCIRRRRDSSDDRQSCMNFRRQRSDRRFVVDPNEQRANLAPKGHGTPSSSTDPMITAGLTLPPDDEPEPYYDEPPLHAYRDEPVVVNIGPPLDDDGHLLSSVDLDQCSDPNDFI